MKRCLEEGETSDCKVMLCAQLNAANLRLVAGSPIGFLQRKNRNFFGTQKRAFFFHYLYCF